jgi:caa(3)-type oxidase subunit IV
MSEHAQSQEHEGDHGGGHDINYVKIWAILCVLLCVSVAGPFLEIQVITLVTAFGIAFVKASMVIKYFMHLDVERPVVHYILITCLVFMVLLFSALAPDIMEHEGSNWENLAAQNVVTAGLAEMEAGGDHGGDDSHGGGGDHH